MEIEETVLDFNRICRLCLTEETVMSSLYNEGDTDSDSVPLPIRIMACASVEISSNDGLPSQICASCLCQVDGWYRFKDLCESADSILRKCIKNEPVQVEAISEVKTMAQEVKKYFSSDLKGDANDQNKNLSPKKKMNFFSNRCPEESAFIRRAKEIVELSKIKPINFDVVRKTTADYTSSSSEGEGEEDEENENEGDVKNHEEVLEKTRKYFVCPCGKKYPTNYQLEIHQEFRCSKVKFEGPSYTTLNSSDDETYCKRIKDQHIVYVCGCNKCFLSKEVMKKHQDTDCRDDDWLIYESADEDGAVSYVCECKSRLANLDSLKEHISKGKCKSHSNSNMKFDYKNDKFRRKVYSCQTCGRTFCVKNIFLKHLRDKKCKEREPVNGYSCPHCGEVFKQKLQRRRHIADRHPPQYQCEHCKKQFTNVTALKNHKTLVHKDGFTKYVCEYCAKKFLGASSLLNHLRTHTNEKPFKCNICSKAFAIERSAKLHEELVHGPGEKNFVCHVCGIAFARKEYLATHSFVHKNIRRFECEHCGLTFRWKGGRRKHMFKKHQDKMNLYQCKYCEKKFKLEKNCAAHVAEHERTFGEGNIAATVILGE